MSNICPHRQVIIAYSSVVGHRRLDSPYVIWALLAMSCVSYVGSLVAADAKSGVNGQLVVDLVTLKSGRTLRGSIIRQDATGVLTMVVSRDWLAGANPALLASTLKENLDGRSTGLTQTRDRIADRLKNPPESPQLVFFLKQEKERIDQLLADRNLPEPDFLWFDVRPETISRIVRATAERRKIAILAWNEGLAHVETRESASLVKELTGHGVKLDDALPDLSERLAARRQDDEEWAARMAIVEYSLFKPLDFQGMGDTLTAIREGQPANLGDLIPQILQQQLGSLLKDLGGGGGLETKSKGDMDFLDSAIRLAERENQKGFRVTRLEVDLVANRVTVEARFVAQVAKGKWKTIWRTREISDGTKNRPQAEARIEQDPQLKSALDAMKSLGLADGGKLQEAIRVGAATMSAQQSTDASFSEFRDRYSRRLDGPPLWTTIAP